MPKIYLDTNVMHYFGQAFAAERLAADVSENLLIAPLSLLELLSQLGTRDSRSAFRSINALLNVHDRTAIGLLPWSDDLFRMSLFGLEPSVDMVTGPLNNAVNNVVHTADPANLVADGLEMRRLLDTCKAQAVAEFAAVLQAWRAEGPLNEEVHREIFAHAIARRAKADMAVIDANLIVERLNALYTFETGRMRTGAHNPQYNTSKRANDAYDAELLVYLSEPSFHFLTSDTGFRRVSASNQADRVHILEPKLLSTAASASNILRNILNS